MPIRMKTWCASMALALLSLGSARAELLLYYDFNDASVADVAKDMSGKGNNGDLLGDVDDVPVYTADKDGHTGAAGDRAMDFGFYSTNGGAIGSGAYLEVSTAPDGAFASVVDNDSVTISLWIRGNDEQPSPQWTFSAWPSEDLGTDRQLGSHIPWDNSNVYFDTAGCCGADTRISVGVPDPSKWDSSGWNHYAFVKDEGYTAIYENGELIIDSGADIKNPLLDISSFYVGAGPSTDRRSYSGMIDDFALWDSALSEDQILAIANGAPILGPPVGTPGDFNNDSVLDAADIDALSAQVRGATNPAAYDVTGDNLVNDADRELWVNSLKKTYYGDSNLDGEFNSGDFVFVFTSGQYEDAIAGNSSWATGDWNGDTDFTSSDFVTAFSAGGYEAGPRAAVSSVPEPTSAVLLLCGLAGLAARRRK